MVCQKSVSESKLAPHLLTPTTNVDSLSLKLKWHNMIKHRNVIVSPQPLQYVMTSFAQVHTHTVPTWYHIINKV